MEPTHDGFVQFCEQALRDGTSVNGVLDISPLADTLDLIVCMPVDTYLHKWLKRCMFCVQLLTPCSSGINLEAFFQLHQFLINESFFVLRIMCKEQTNRL